MKALALLLLSASLVACTAKPNVASTQDFVSPDGQTVATVEEIDNGLGFGAGVLYDEVHVSKAPKPAFEHGGSDATVVFVAEAAETAGSGPQVSWLGPHKLRISLDQKTIPLRQLITLGSTSIEYVVRAQ